MPRPVGSRRKELRRKSKKKNKGDRIGTINDPVTGKPQFIYRRESGQTTINTRAGIDRRTGPVERRVGIQVDNIVYMSVSDFNRLENPPQEYQNLTQMARFREKHGIPLNEHWVFFQSGKARRHTDK